MIFPSRWMDIYTLLESLFRYFFFVFLIPQQRLFLWPSRLMCTRRSRASRFCNLCTYLSGSVWNELGGGGWGNAWEAELRRVEIVVICFSNLFSTYFLFRCIITTDSVDPSLFPLACVGFIWVMLSIMAVDGVTNRRVSVWWSDASHTHTADEMPTHSHVGCTEDGSL